MKNKKKIKTELDDSIFPFILYPKEYVITILFTIVISSICLMVTYFLITDVQLNFDYFMIVIFTLMILLISIHYIAVSYCLIIKRISLEVSKEEVKLKGVIKEKSVTIKDITYIYRKGGGKQGRAIIFQCNNDNNCFRIPNNWFSEKELMELFSLLMRMDGKILLGISSF